MDAPFEDDVPAAQATGLLTAPVGHWYPALQGVQLTALPGLYEPAVQGTGLTEGSRQECPAGQGAQTIPDSAVLYEPCMQMAQLALPAALM